MCLLHDKMRFLPAASDRSFSCDSWYQPDNELSSQQPSFSDNVTEKAQLEKSEYLFEILSKPLPD